MKIVFWCLGRFFGSFRNVGEVEVGRGIGFFRVKRVGICGIIIFVL